MARGRGVSGPHRQQLWQQAAGEYGAARGVYLELKTRGALPESDIQHIEELTTLQQKARSGG
jgi:hypothetical protein